MTCCLKGGALSRLPTGPSGEKDPPDGGRILTWSDRGPLSLLHWVDPPEDRSADGSGLHATEAGGVPRAHGIGCSAISLGRNGIGVITG